MQARAWDGAVVWERRIGVRGNVDCGAVEKVRFFAPLRMTPLV
jgi:hypothetical protein